jgi:tRNA (mo5U34)-methyltransferase
MNISAQGRTMFQYNVKLKDEDLAELNRLLPWHAGTQLEDGRILGSLEARRGKREEVQRIPDKRITRLNQALDLRDKTVLEIGCFEGIHTIGLCSYGAKVTAVDLRPLNVIKTAVRLAAYGYAASVLPLDVEDETVEIPDFDVVFHCGVLYHLEDPVDHLKRLLPHAGTIYLDTHVAEEDQEDATLESGGQTFVGHKHYEAGWNDPFSGRGTGAFWLKTSDLKRLLDEAGFKTEVWSERQERNGFRIGLLATRS